MNIYTKNGDRGTTSLMNGISVSKADDRSSWWAPSMN